MLNVSLSICNLYLLLWLIFVQTKFQIIAYAETCPDITGCPQEFIISDGCCPHCKEPSYSQVNCDATSVSLNDTVKLISKRDLLHGVCANPDQIIGFTKCNGQCDTFPFYDEGER